MINLAFGYIEVHKKNLFGLEKFEIAWKDKIEKMEKEKKIESWLPVGV